MPEKREREDDRHATGHVPPLPSPARRQGDATSPLPQKYGREKGRKAHAKEFPVVRLHKICHRMIHALFSEKYLAEHLNTIEALRAHHEMQSFLEFIEDKPPSFDVRVRRNKEKQQRDKPGILP